MASQTFDRNGTNGARPFSGSSPTFNRSHQLAAMRASVIAVVLLGVLALVILI